MDENPERYETAKEVAGKAIGKYGLMYITAYADLTQEQVVGWVQDALGKDTVEASLAGQIEALKHPTQATGLPW
jgi:hypothetical protein